jgi:hypothetical protein
VSLLREIQEEAASQTTATAGLLRKAQILATRLDHQPLAEWVDRELNGYYDVPHDEVPPYRRLGKVQVLGNFHGFGGSQMKNAPIAELSIDKEYKALLCMETDTSALTRRRHSWDRPEGLK